MEKISHSRNSVLTLLSWLIPLGLTFFATPFIIRRLGNEQYGFYALIIGFIAYSFTFNTGRSLTKYVSEFNSRGETKKVSEIISATFFLSLGVATVGCAVLFFFSDFLVTRVFLIDAASRVETIFGLHIAAVCIWLTIIGQVFGAIVQGRHRFDVIAAITTFNNALLILGNIYLVWKGFGFVALLTWNAVTLLIGTVIYFLTAKKLEPETKISFGFDRTMFLISLKYGLSVAGHQLFGNFLLLFERSLITRLEGVDKMTNYVVPITISIYIMLFVSTLTQNLMPITSELFARKRFADSELIYRRLTKIVFALLVFICLSMAVGSYYLLANWLDVVFAETSYQVFIFQIVTFGLMAAMGISWQYIEGYGLPVYNTLSGFSWMIIAIPLMLIWTRSYGIWGAALARLVGEITIPIAILLIERKIFGKFLGDLWLKIIGVLGITGLIVGFIEYQMLKYFPVNWLSLIGSVLVCGVIYLFILWLTNFFSKEEQIWLGGHIKRIFT